MEIKSTGEFLGYVGLHEIGFDADFTPGVEIGWRLAADYHNQGYATEAAKAVLSLAKSAGIERLFSFTAKINAPSERVMQKIGMVKAGEFSPLTGNYAGHMECHIEGDFLLIWFDPDTDEINLVRLGSHSELFG